MLANAKIFHNILKALIYIYIYRYIHKLFNLLGKKTESTSSTSSGCGLAGGTGLQLWLSPT